MKTLLDVYQNLKEEYTFDFVLEFLQIITINSFNLLEFIPSDSI